MLHHHTGTFAKDILDYRYNAHSGELDLSYLELTNDDDISTIAAFIQERFVASLNLSYSNITIEGIDHITRSTKLYFLNLDHINSNTSTQDTLTQNTLILSNYYHPDRRELDLSHLPLLNNNDMLELDKFMQKYPVTSLNLSFTPITDLGVGHLTHSETLTTLDSLNLAGTAITEKAVKTLTERLPKLTELDLSMCKGVNNKCVGMIADNMPDIRELYLHHNNNISVDTARNLLDARQNPGKELHEKISKDKNGNIVILQYNLAANSCTSRKLKKLSTLTLFGCKKEPAQTNNTTDAKQKPSFIK